MLGLTLEEREMFIPGKDLKDEDKDNSCNNYNNDCDPRDLTRKFLFTKCYFNPITLYVSTKV